MPSQWKFEIFEPNKFTKSLIDLGAILKSSEQFEDIYYSANRGSSKRTTKKIRIFQNTSARLIQFDRDETGAVDNLHKTDILNFEEAFENIGNQANEVMRLSKQVSLYLLSWVEVGLHKFTNGSFFVSLDGEDQIVRQVVELLPLSLEDAIGLSFDEIFEI